MWDEIIVGSGSSGGVLASRLSENPDRRVQLLEAGPDFPDGQIPAAIQDSRAPVMSGYNWDFQANLRSRTMLQNLLNSASVAAAAPRDMFTAAKAAMRSSRPLTSTMQQFPYFVGRVVGGSSSVNGAVALRALKEDLDQWAALGNTEWGWDDVLPFYRKLEADRDFQDDRHGVNGPVPVTRPRIDQLEPLQAAFQKACEQMGMPLLADMNAGSQAGVGPVPTNSVNHVRMSTALAYVAAARRRPNLSIQTDCMVDRVLFQGRRAVGVEFVSKGVRRTLFGKRITICAGAINTPPILLRSGVGRSELCRSLGVSLVADLPGVGEHLMDHPAVMFWMTPKEQTNENAQLTHQVMARISTTPAVAPDLNLFILGNLDTATVPMLREILRCPRANAISVVLTKPTSRGRVWVESSAVDAKPMIDLNLASTSDDMERLMRGVRLAWKLSQTRPIEERTGSVFLWTQAIIDYDALLKNAVSRFVNGAWHASGTARMGPSDDRMAVVDQHFRVHGVNGLRIVDASVMPAIPSAAPNLTCIMLAERAASWMQVEAE